MKHQALPVPVFNGENYHLWSIKMTTYFKSQGLWETVECGVRKSSLEEELRRDPRALFTIQQAVTDEIFPRICDATSAKQAWEILQEEFRGPAEARSSKLRFYQGEFDRDLRKGESETCQEYYSRLRLLVSRIRYYGGVVREEDAFWKLLDGLPREFDPVASALVAAREITPTLTREMIGSLEAFEMSPGQCDWGGEGVKL